MLKSLFFFFLFDFVSIRNKKTKMETGPSRSVCLFFRKDKFFFYRKQIEAFRKKQKT